MLKTELASINPKNSRSAVVESRKLHSWFQHFLFQHYISPLDKDGPQCTTKAYAGLGWSMLKASLWEKGVKNASHYNLLAIVT
jgi:hypothetical protein